MQCIQADCAVRAVARGLCNPHYQRWYHRGGRDQVAVPLHVQFPDERDRYWAQVQRGPDCWLWIGKLNPNGYGTTGWQGNTRLAHRVALMMLDVPLVAGAMVCHHCDVRRCVNPDHLYVGDALSNVADMYARGRAVDHGLKGEANSQHKLTEDSVRSIRRLSAAGISQHELARRFGVSRPAIGYVLSGKTWAHVK